VVDPDRYLSVFRAETVHIAAFAAHRELDVPVPACAGFTAGGVIRHLGSVYRRVTAWIRTQEPPEDWDREPPPGGDLVGWFSAGASDLYTELRGRRSKQACATWWAYDQTMRFWWRRMAHETLVHRTDVESAFGPIGPIDRDIAADGADEVLNLFLGYRLTAPSVPGGWTADQTYAGGGQIVGVAAGPRLWRVELGERSVDVSPELPHDADVLVLGDAADVYLWLWGRQGDAALRVSGDLDAAAALRAALAIATQ
jgi:uncharacterized protein (TIGR03083 family)